MDKKIFAINTHTHINNIDSRNPSLETVRQDNSLEWVETTNKAAFVDKVFCTTFCAVAFEDDVEKENDYIQKLAEENDFLYFYVTIEPRTEGTFKQAEEMLKSDKCVGIKIHPSNHKYTLDEYGDKIFEFAAKHNAIVLIHPDAAVDYILPFADKYPEVTFIMAHLGTYSSDSYVNAIKNAKHGNVYTDVSGRASTYNKIIEYTVANAGSDKILFGNDLYGVGFQRGRIEYAVISEEDKENILRNNALRLFGKIINK